MSDDQIRERVAAAVAGQYEIEAEIGRGGMAVVYRARDVRLKRRVALKILPPELAFRADVKSRFLREAQTAAQLNHPHIVPIYAVDEAESIVFFAMGLVEGETLAQQLAREPRPAIDVVRRILGDVCEALAYAHAHGVVHRDIKPDNILIDRASGRALVSDFGIARAAAGDLRLTATGIAVGTPTYMSPEQAMGEREVDGRSDLYALGIVGYHMIAGEPPFQATNTPAMLMKHISEAARPLHERRADVPANLVSAIERAMAKGADERWPDAHAFRDALAVDAPAAPRPRRAHPPTAGVDAPASSAPVGHWSYREATGAVPAVRPPDAGAVAPDYPRFPALPPNWMFNPDTREFGRSQLKEWRQQQRQWKEQIRAAKRAGGQQAADQMAAALQGTAATPEFRIQRFQRYAVGTVGTIAFLGVINGVTSPQFPWVIFPALGMGIGLISRSIGLWLDGIPLSSIFSRQKVELPPSGTTRGVSGAAPPRALPAHVSDGAVRQVLAKVPADVLAGPHGGALRGAADAKASILSTLASLSEADAKMLPPVTPTVDALIDRIAELVMSLHQLDQDASPDARRRLDERVAELRALPESAPDRERRLTLLERQQSTLSDLASRRDAVARSLDNATTLLDTMKLDLLKLRSSGLQSQFADQTLATQEARAVASEIERAIDVAAELRRL